MTPMTKLVRPHGGDGIEHSWIVDRTHPMEVCDSEGRKSWHGGKPWISMRCGAPRGCIARAFVLESDLIALVEFPSPRKRVQRKAVVKEATP